MYLKHLLAGINRCFEGGRTNLRVYIRNVLLRE